MLNLSLFMKDGSIVFCFVFLAILNVAHFYCNESRRPSLLEFGLENRMNNSRLLTVRLFFLYDHHHSS
jgi:hypothetical protein